MRDAFLASNFLGKNSHIFRFNVKQWHSLSPFSMQLLWVLKFLPSHDIPLEKAYKQNNVLEDNARRTHSVNLPCMGNVTRQGLIRLRCNEALKMLRQDLGYFHLHNHGQERTSPTQHCLRYVPLSCCTLHSLLKDNFRCHICCDCFPVPTHYQSSLPLSQGYDSVGSFKNWIHLH